MIYYTVKRGDSLSKIARDMLGDMARWPEIAQMNNIPDPYVIEIGEVLRLPLPKPGALPEVQTTAEPSVRHIEKGTVITATPPVQPAVKPVSRMGHILGMVLVGGALVWGLLGGGSNKPKTTRRRRRR